MEAIPVSKGLDQKPKTPEYITVREVSGTWGVTRRWVNMCIAGGRVPGAVRVDNMWQVPPEQSPFSDLSSVIETTTPPPCRGTIPTACLL